MRLFFTITFIFSNILFSNEINIFCRDSLTGKFLKCLMKADGKEFVLSRGLNLIEMEGDVELALFSEGYKELKANFKFPSEINSITFFLDKKELYFEEDIEYFETILTGHVYDKNKGVPLKDVIVKSEFLEAFTDEDGYFEIKLEARDFDFNEEIPLLRLEFFKERYKNLILKNVQNIKGKFHFIVDMEEGEGEVILKDEHHFFYNEIKEDFEEDLINDKAMKPEYLKLGENLPEQFLLQVVDPPDTIRLGTNCSCTTCSSVEVMSLETYVKRGLNDEWISSWNTHSLRSGSIAYRSYGAYYVLHPLSSNYDICNNTCCQVNDSDTATSTNIATEKTTGILLQRNGAIFRSEYSAENNSWDDPNDGLSCVNSDLSCGNGYAGSPSANWPCLSDSPCLNYGCFGHGRGMCQWGTQRWAANNSKLWKWIVNHYYNNNGSGSGLRTAYMTSPFSINSVSPNPSTISPGGSFTINLNVTSYAEISNPQIMIGASLYSSSTGYISDPSNDNKITLNPGSNNPSRQFVTPSNIPEGTYDLIVALWLDVNEDNLITGDDLSLISYTLANAITVSGIIYGTCSNPYIVSSFPYSHSSSNNSQQSLSSYNCNSLAGSTGKETIYKITLNQEGILSASISPSTNIDLYLTKSCTNYTCISFGDSQINEYLQPGNYYLIVDGTTTTSYNLSLNFSQYDRSRPVDNASLRVYKYSNQLLLTWAKPQVNIYGGAENIVKTNIFRGTNPLNLRFYSSSTENSLLLNDLSSSENYFYRLSFEDSWGNRSVLCQLETIVDNTEANFEGNWQTSSSQPDRYGENYSYSWGSGNDLNKAHYSPVLFCPLNNYSVFTFYPATTNRCLTTKFLVNHSSGSSTFYLDQTKNGGKWNLLGNFYFDKSYKTIISDGTCPSDKAVIADALMWLPSPPSEIILDDDDAIFAGDWIRVISSYGYNGDYWWRSTGGNGSNYALWVPYLYERGNYDIYVWYREGTNRSSQAPYIITTANGDVTIYVNQQQNGSQWYKIGTFELNPATAKVKLTDNAPSGYVIVADAVRFLKIN